MNWPICTWTIECGPKKYFSYFSTKTYVVGTQKNPLNDILTYVKTDRQEDIYNFMQ